MIISETIFVSIFNGGVDLWNTVAMFLFALGLGATVAATYMIKCDYTKGFVITLTLMPIITATIVVAMNGLLEVTLPGSAVGGIGVGTGVAIAGAFAIVRFRSVQGGVREICMILFAAAIGFVLGLGHVLFAVIFAVVVGGTVTAIKFIPLGEELKHNDRMLRITIPEDVNYTEIFNQVFSKYLKKYELERVKTSNMGSMYELKYHIVLKDRTQEKAFIDELRIINSNLPIICGVCEQPSAEV